MEWASQSRQDLGQPTFRLYSTSPSDPLAFPATMGHILHTDLAMTGAGRTLPTPKPPNPRLAGNQAHTHGGYCLPGFSINPKGSRASQKQSARFLKGKDPLGWWCPLPLV